MAARDQLRQIAPKDQFIESADGRITGVQIQAKGSSLHQWLTVTEDTTGAATVRQPNGGVLAMSETSPYVTLTATGTAFTGACELAGWYCSVAAGNITIYDATSATGTPIVPATALVVGPLPIFGAGTTGKLALTTGCHVVLSGAATVRVLVA